MFFPIYFVQSLRFTAPGGSITVSAIPEEQMVSFFSVNRYAAHAISQDACFRFLIGPGSEIVNILANCGESAAVSVTEKPNHLFLRYCRNRDAAARRCKTERIGQ